MRRYEPCDISAGKEKLDYFSSYFLAWGGFVAYLVNPRLNVSQYGGKQMVVFRSRGGNLTYWEEKRHSDMLVLQKCSMGLCCVVREL